MHPVESLFHELEHIGPYPEGVVPAFGRVPGTTFFPGGPGLWGTRSGSPLPAMPVGGVMIVGQDYASAAEFGRSLRRGSEVSAVTTGTGSHLRASTLTFRGLLALLPSVPVPWERCFFTNAYMGLRKSGSSTGPSPASRDPDFADRCRDFFCVQLAVQRPVIVLALGRWVPAFIAECSDQLKDWRGRESFAQLDSVGPIVHNVKFAFASACAPPCSVVSLMHPSYRHLNVDGRTFKGSQGDDAERAMIREALRVSPLRGVDV